MRKYHFNSILYLFRLVFEVIMGVIILITMALELFMAFFAVIDFKSLEKAQ
jgi:hypothetical protein